MHAVDCYCLAQLTLTFIFVIWMKHIRRIGILARVQLLLGV
jgi:hypothetical protein